MLIIYSRVKHDSCSQNWYNLFSMPSRADLFLAMCQGGLKMSHDPSWAQANLWQCTTVGLSPRVGLFSDSTWYLEFLCTKFTDQSEGQIQVKEVKQKQHSPWGHPGAANTRNTRVSRSSFIVIAPCSSAVFNEFWLLIHFINLLSVFLFSYLSPVFLRLCLCLSCLYFSVFVLLMSTVFFILVNTLPSMSAVPWVPSFVIVFLTSIFPYLDSLFGLCLLNFTHL